MLTLQQFVETVAPKSKTIHVRQLTNIEPPVSLRMMLNLPVWNELYQFKQSPFSGVWPHIAKDMLVEDMRKTVLNPLNVDQESVPLCGPTAVVYELAARQPHRFVQFCRQLWEMGFLVARGKTIKASDTLRNSPNPPLTPADWILIATLREDENLLLEIDSDVNKFEGFSAGALWVSEILGPSSMKTWSHHILGFDNIDSLSTILTEEMKALGMAHDAWEAGGVAFLLINGNMLRPGNDCEIWPDHWVAYHGDLQIDITKEVVHFHCYTWGEIKEPTIKIDKFTSCMFGVVTATP